MAISILSPICCYYSISINIGNTNLDYRKKELSTVGNNDIKNHKIGILYLCWRENQTDEDEVY